MKCAETIAATVFAMLLGCGAPDVGVGAEAADADAVADALLTDAANDVAADAAIAVDASWYTFTPACVTLTLAFAGCDAQALQECEAEYAALPATVRAVIDADGACFRASPSYAKSFSAWPYAGSANCPAALTLNQAWFHGGCQGQNAQVVTAMASANPCGGSPNACATFTDSTSCPRQQGCTWSGALGPCTGTPVACNQIWPDGTQCGSQAGCSNALFPFCGRPSQPICFFTGTI